MMNSSAGDNSEFPENPFRSTANQPSIQQGDAQQTSLNQFYANEAPQVVPQPTQQPPQQSIPMPAVQPQQFTHMATPQPQSSAPYTQPAPVNQPSVQNQTVSANNNNENVVPLSRWQICMSCFKIETYIAYFDIDTNDFFDRIKHSLLFFYLPDKFRSEVIGVVRTENLKGPDLYGPLWITMTLVFFVAVSYLLIFVLCSQLYLIVFLIAR